MRITILLSCAAILSSCADAPITYYAAYDPVSEPVTCNQPCGEQVTYCDRVARCEDPGVVDPEACRMAAADLHAGGILVECTIQTWGGE